MIMKKTFSSVLLITGGCLLVANLLFEGVSIIGAKMCLDSNWADICVQMLVCHVWDYGADIWSTRNQKEEATGSNSAIKLFERGMLLVRRARRWAGEV